MFSSQNNNRRIFTKLQRKRHLALSMNQNTLRDGQETFTDTAKTSLHTKIHAKLADVLTEAAVDSILVINKR